MRKLDHVLVELHFDQEQDSICEDDKLHCGKISRVIFCHNSVQDLMVKAYVFKLMCPNYCNQNQSFGIRASKFSWMTVLMQLNCYITEISDRGQNTCCTVVIHIKGQNSEAYIVIILLLHKSFTIPGFGDVIRSVPGTCKIFNLTGNKKITFPPWPTKVFHNFFMIFHI